MNEFVTKAECSLCQERNCSERNIRSNAIASLRREVYILLGTSTTTIIISAINLILNYTR